VLGLDLLEGFGPVRGLKDVVPFRLEL
jgi:hypothetical protein